MLDSEVSTFFATALRIANQKQQRAPRALRSSHGLLGIQRERIGPRTGPGDCIASGLRQSPSGYVLTYRQGEPPRPPVSAARTEPSSAIPSCAWQTLIWRQSTVGWLFHCISSAFIVSFKSFWSSLPFYLWQSSENFWTYVYHGFSSCSFLRLSSAQSWQWPFSTPLAIIAFQASCTAMVETLTMLQPLLQNLGGHKCRLLRLRSCTLLYRRIIRSNQRGGCRSTSASSFVEEHRLR